MLIGLQFFRTKAVQLQTKAFGQCQQALLALLMRDAGQSGQVIHSKAMRLQAVQQQAEQVLHTATTTAAQPSDDLNGGSGAARGVAGDHLRRSVCAAA